MKRDKISADIINKAVDEAIASSRGRWRIDRARLAAEAYPRMSDARRRELAISRLSQQIGASERRKLAQPVIPGLLADDGERSAG